MRTTILAITAAGAFVAAVHTARAQAVERRTLSGSDIAVYNLAGMMRVEGTSGGDVVVEVTRGGGDATQLKIETGEIRGRQTLRVIYPGDDIVYRVEGGWGGGSTEMDVRDDGTFNDQHGGRGFFSGRRRVRISGRGRGLDAHADLRVLVPAGKHVAVYLAVGKATVSNVDGDLRVDVSSADIDATHTRGRLYLDTGSGNVTLSDAQGDVTLDTGSGDVRVTGMTGTQLSLDTGSGNVTVDRAEADVLKVDTGSGDVDLSAVQARDVNVDTGSGDVRIALRGHVESLYVDTGSGGVTLSVPPDFGAEVDIETGSGGIDLGGVQLQTRRIEQDHIVGTIGDGRGRVRIETGSGEVRLVKRS
jgi:hypothetical protein